MFSKFKSKAQHIYLGLGVMLTADAAFADGFGKAKNLLTKIQNGLHGLALVIITVAFLWVGYRVMWLGDTVRDCSKVIIGAIIVASASEIAALLI